MSIPDNYSQRERHEREQQRQLEERPICSNCLEHIQEEKAYCINGELICKGCMESDFEVDVEDYME